MAKQNKKYFDKRLCDAGTGSVLLCVFAFLFAGVSLLLEPIGYAVHNSKFDLDIGLFSGSPWYNYMIAYDKHIIITLIAFAAMLICIRNRSRKKLGAELGIMLTFSALACCLISSMALLSAYDNGLLSKSYAVLNSSDISQDFRDFDRFMAMLYYLLPTLGAALLFIAGLMLWGRSATEEFKVKCPVVVRVVEPIYPENDKPAETAPPFEYGSTEPAAATPIVPATTVPEAPVPVTGADKADAPEIAPNQEARPYNPFSQIEPRAVVPAPEEHDPEAEAAPEKEPEAEEKPEPDKTETPEPEKTEKPKKPQRFCPSCGGEVNGKAKFCPSCGSKIELE